MIENLLAYGLNNGNEAGPTVETALNELDQQIASFKRKENGFKEIVKNLSVVKDMVEKKEKEFYIKIGVDDYSDLNARIQELEDKYKIFLPDGAIMKEIKQKFDFSKVRNASDDELAEAVADTVNEFLLNEMTDNYDFFNSTMSRALGVSSSTDAILAYLQKNLTTKEGGKRFVTVRNSKGSARKVGLGRIITHYNAKTNKVRVEVSEIKKLSSGFRKKIEEELSQIYLQENWSNSGKINVYELGETPKDSRAIYRKYVNDIIQKHFKLPFDIVDEQYDLNRSISSTTGYLGEVRATLFLKELAPDAPVRATGNLRDAIKNWEIPIDLICAANGFQIKNYQLDDNSVTFSNSLQATNWIENRLKFTGTINQVLTALFGIYQFNQPLSNSIYKKEGAKMPEDLPFYQAVYMRIEDMFNELKSVFDSRIPEMIKIIDEFSVQGDPLLHGHKLYFNTFFWINRYLVPASWILNELIKELEKKESERNTIHSAYTFNNSKHDSLRFQIKGRAFQKTGKPPANLYSAAQRVRVNYYITIDLSHFANLRF